MVVEPKVKGFICTTAHPKGCEESVRRQIACTKEFAAGKDFPKDGKDFPKKVKDFPKKVLIVGASTGYGLASRIAVTYGCNADTIGVAFERESNGKRTATAGWYNTKAFEKFAREDGYFARTFNGDGFSAEMKEQVIECIRQEFGQVDMVIYSMAAPRRTLADGTVVSSVLKTVGEPFTNKTIDLRTNEIKEVTVPEATDDEIRATVQVMGGEDWKDWIRALNEAGVIQNGAVTLAYSYIGPVVTHPIYKEGSIGQAKKHLYDTSLELTQEFSDIGLRAYISVNKAVVTQSSAAIPIVPLYISLLYRVMKDEGLHEGCIEQMNRLFLEKLVGDVETDETGQIRMDDYEMKDEVQKKIAEVWEDIDSESVQELGDIRGFWDEFYHMFGFHYDNVDYSEDVEI